MNPYQRALSNDEQAAVFKGRNAVAQFLKDISIAAQQLNSAAYDANYAESSMTGDDSWDEFKLTQCSKAPHEACEASWRAMFGAGWKETPIEVERTDVRTVRVRVPYKWYLARYAPASSSSSSSLVRAKWSACEILLIALLALCGPYLLFFGLSSLYQRY